MLDRSNAAMVDAAAENAVPSLGCRTLCQHPGCGLRIVVVQEPDGTRVWVHDEPWEGQDHRATPVGQPEPSPGERLVASVTESYGAHRQARTDANPVRPLHLRLMAERWAMSVHERTSLLWTEGVTSPGYLRLRAASQRQHKALLRLTAALERQAGGGW